MNVNKKLGRLKHWAGEKMAGEVRTTQTDEFKNLEVEMGLRQEGMEKLHRSMNVYIRSLSKRSEGDDKEKATAIAQLGASAVSHADDFEPESEFGQCLSRFGRANERIARIQENYVSAASSSWLDSLERSLAQMKEYQSARKKLESRRLAYDSSQARMQKSKKEDFRLEEDLRSQKAKYEDSTDDVHRRMLDIREAESDSVTDLAAFIDAELAYHDRARQILLQLKADWPGPQNARDTDSDPGMSLPLPMPIRSRVSSLNPSPVRERPGFDFSTPSRSRPASPGSLPRLSRVPTDTSVLSARASLRPPPPPAPSAGSRARADSEAGDVFSDAQSTFDSADSPPSSVDGRRMAPPPPPSRAKKPPPPPPPLKRSALSSGEVRVQ